MCLSAHTYAHTIILCHTIQNIVFVPMNMLLPYDRRYKFIKLPLLQYIRTRACSHYNLTGGMDRMGKKHTALSALRAVDRERLCMNVYAGSVRVFVCVAYTLLCILCMWPLSGEYALVFLTVFHPIHASWSSCVSDYIHIQPKKVIGNAKQMWCYWEFVLYSMILPLWSLSLATNASPIRMSIFLIIWRCTDGWYKLRINWYNSFWLVL